MKNNFTFIKGTVIKNKHMKNEYYKIIIKAPRIAETAKPGQFVMLSKWKLKELLLKRPFSFYEIDAQRGSFAILYKKVGKGTAILAESKVGEEVEIIGPLGNGFKVPEKIKSVAIVARGIGIAPMIPLIRQNKKDQIDIYSFLSASTSELLLCEDIIEFISKEVYYTTDDGSKGARGNVTVFLENLLEQKNQNIDVVYTCGSKRLARHIKELQKEYRFAAYVSLEERMGCGIGACKGCVINTIHGYRRVCKEGPVFSLEEVILNEG